MCGLIAVKYSGDARPQLNMDALTGNMIHRGPDRQGYARFAGADLGFCRLSIIDLETGHQPMYNEDQSLCLVFNGEIYNYRELRRQLLEKGHSFSSRADSEVILHLYEEEGQDLVHRLRGMYAFCLYDLPNKRLFGARDRFGIKPLYYVSTEWGLALASEAKVLLSLPGVKRGVDLESLDRYLTFQYVPDPYTMFRGLYRIPPGHLFWCDSSGFHLERYWEATFDPQDRSLEELMEDTRQVLRESVALHTQSDVPLGAFLSGGVDSAIIVALLRERGPLSTFSVGYDHPGYSELDKARETARFLETEHSEYVIGAQEYWRHLPRMVWHMDEPVADPSAQSLFFVARLARKAVKVVLSGEGADEVFGGYDIYREPLSLRYLSWLPGPMRELLARGASAIPPGIRGRSYLWRAAVPMRERYVGNAFIFSPEEKRRLLKGMAPAPLSELTSTLYEKARGYDGFTTMQYIDINTWMVGDILMKADKMTMANSLELRVPYLDQEVFALARRVPTRHKVKGSLTKYLLRRAFSDLIPEEVALRPKLGFPVPTREWLKREWGREIDQVLLDPSMAAFYSLAQARKLLSQHRQGRADHSRKLFTLLVFSLWWDCFMR